MDRAGWTVHGLARRPEPWTPVQSSVCDLAEESSDGVLSAAVARVRTVVHLAGVNEWRTAQHPGSGLTQTALATQRVAEACRRSDVERLVYVSTWLVYGDRIRPGHTLTEETHAEPRTAYAIARLASEHLAAAASDGSFEVVILRLTNAVGPPLDCRIDRWSLITNDLCRQATLTGEMRLRTPGLQWRDFIPLSRVCSVITAACHTAGSGSELLPPGTYNVASGEAITVRDLAGKVRHAFQHETGVDVPLLHPSTGDLADESFQVSTSALHRYLPLTGDSLDRAVTDTVRFCLSRREELPT